MLYLKNTTESNAKALSYVEIAKQKSPSIDVYKTEILANLRQGNKAKATTLLTNYLSRLDELNKSMEGSDYLLSRNYNYIIEEISWAKDMIVKLQGM